MKKLTVAGCLAALLTLSTCEVLEQEPVDRIDLEAYYSNAGEAETALIGCYNYTLRGEVATNFIFFNNRSSDDLTAPLDGRGSDPLMARNNLTVNNDGGSGDLWRACYQALANLNLLIERVPQIADNDFVTRTDADGKRKSEILAEARFLRAYIYYHMALYWGDVPLVTRFPSTTNPQANQLERTPVAQVWQLVEEDLQFAEANLPWNHNNLTELPADQAIQSKGRATRGAAKVLLARVYLKDQKWQQALAKANEVITDGGFTLSRRWVNIFDAATAGQNSSESIMEIQTRQGPREFNNNGGYAWFHQDGRPRRGATLEAYNLFEGDANARKDVRQVYSMFQREDNPNEIYAIKYQNAFPWWDPKDPFNFIIARLTECYLIKAEALNELGFPNQEAVDILNQVRARARDEDYQTGAVEGIAPLRLADFNSQAALRQAIRDERRRELMFEGFRWFDLLRYDSYDNGDRALRAVGATDRNKLLFPIPQREMNLPGNRLIQNPGYN